MSYESNTSVASYLLLHLHQTNNIAELYASLWTVHHSTEPKIVVYSDSNYLVRGIALRAHSWRMRNWIGRSGPMSNPQLWSALLDAIQSRFTAENRHLRWLVVPAHVEIQGKAQADDNANKCRMSSPLYPTDYDHPRKHDRLQLHPPCRPHFSPRREPSEQPSPSPVKKAPRMDVSPLRPNNLMPTLNLVQPDPPPPQYAVTPGRYLRLFNGVTPRCASISQ